MSELNMNFANNVKYYMHLNNLTRKELACRLQVGYTTVCDWCRGETMPGDKMLIDQMCEIFGCKRTELLCTNDTDISELDLMLGKISAADSDYDLRFMREYIELSNAQKVLLTDISRQFKKG